MRMPRKPHLIDFLPLDGRGKTLTQRNQWWCTVLSSWAVAVARFQPWWHREYSSSGGNPAQVLQNTIYRDVHVKGVSLFYSTSSWDEIEAKAKLTLCVLFLGMQTTGYSDEKFEIKRTWKTLQFVFCFSLTSQLFKLKKNSQTKKPQPPQQFFAIFLFCSYWQWQGMRSHF